MSLPSQPLVTVIPPGPSAQTPARLKRVRSHAVWEGRMRTRLQVRDFDAFYTGEPEPAGGDNSAPTPMEYVIAALNGCLAVVVETVAGELDISIEAMELESEGTMDTRGFAGTADVSPHFTQVTNRIRFTTSADPASLDQLKEAVLRRCPALNLVKDAGVPLVLDWSVTKDPVQVESKSGGAR